SGARRRYRRYRAAQRRLKRDPAIALAVLHRLPDDPDLDTWLGDWLAGWDAAMPAGRTDAPPMDLMEQLLWELELEAPDRREAGTVALFYWQLRAMVLQR